MEQTLTPALQPTQERIAKIEELLKAFAAACNYANQVAPQSSGACLPRRLPCWASSLMP